MLNLHKDCVPRWQYDELRADHKELLEKYHALKLAGAQQSREQREPKPTRVPHDPMLDKLTAEIQGTVTDPLAARAEAERIKREAFGGSL